jgi:hypothetical protein
MVASWYIHTGRTQPIVCECLLGCGASLEAYAYVLAHVPAKESIAEHGSYPDGTESLGVCGLKLWILVPSLDYKGRANMIV